MMTTQKIMMTKMNKSMLIYQADPTVPEAVDVAVDLVFSENRNKLVKDELVFKHLISVF